MTQFSMKECLESGIHFGHQTKRWNPKMKPYIFGARNGIYIIDLKQTVDHLKVATDFIKKSVARGKRVLFVGTKKQARDVIYEEANRVEMNYIHYRWLGGMLTNFDTIKNNINRLIHLNNIENDGTINQYTKKERLKLNKEKEKLVSTIGGISNMKKLPDILFIVDTKNEQLAVREAKKLNIPIVALIDTNCDPDEVDFLIPGNDDAIRSIKYITSKIADACEEGKKLHLEQKQAKTDKEETQGEEKVKQDKFDKLIVEKKD